MNKAICFSVVIWLILVIVSLNNVFSEDTFEEKVIKVENSHIWKPQDEYEGLLSQIETLLTMCDNFKIIDKAVKGEIQNAKLKEILNTFDSMIKYGHSKENFIKMYDYLSMQMPEGKLTDGSMNIIEVLENGGDCNDFGPLFYSLFQYYGFDTFLILGKSIYKKTEEDSLHVWIGIYFGNELIELDPLWYGSYIELHRSDNTFDTLSVKEKYKIIKK